MNDAQFDHAYVSVNVSFVREPHIKTVALERGQLTHFTPTDRSRRRNHSVTPCNARVSRCHVVFLFTHPFIYSSNVQMTKHLFVVSAHSVICSETKNLMALPSRAQTFLHSISTIILYMRKAGVQIIPFFGQKPADWGGCLLLTITLCPSSKCHRSCHQSTSAKTKERRRTLSNKTRHQPVSGAKVFNCYFVDINTTTWINMCWKLKVHKWQQSCVGAWTHHEFNLCSVRHTHTHSEHTL